LILGEKMKLCVALDLPTRKENLALAQNLAHLADKIWLKVGLRSYLRDGASFLQELKKIGDFRIFLDLKIYDIPNTTADAVEVCAGLGVDMINLHASAGKEAMLAAVNRLAKLKTRPLIIGVSVLTSFDERGWSEIYGRDVAKSAVDMSVMAHECGLDGMVCSAHESLMIKRAVCANLTDFDANLAGHKAIKHSVQGEFEPKISADFKNLPNLDTDLKTAQISKSAIFEMIQNLDSDFTSDFSQMAQISSANLEREIYKQTQILDTNQANEISKFNANFTAQISPNLSTNFLTICPGIRPFDSAKNDQKRVADLNFAKEQKCDFIVVGRPIYMANNPSQICEKILAQIDS
jgi:orotidine 5'-phosphate decarboxylase